MTLQERVLEALGEKALTPKALYLAMSNDSAPAIDGALGALMRGGYVTRELGQYQRTKRQLPAPQDSPSPFSNARPVVVSITSSTPITQLQSPSATVSKEEGPQASPNGSQEPRLGRRERQVFNLIQSGLTPQQVAERLKMTVGTVYAHTSTARRKLGIKVPPPPDVEPIRKSTPPVTAETATAEAKQLSNEAPKREVERRCNPTFSPDLIGRLVEEQRSLAMSLQAMLDRVSHTRQRLADVEQLVRIATAKEGLER